MPLRRETSSQRASRSHCLEAGAEVNVIFHELGNLALGVGRHHLADDRLHRLRRLDLRHSLIFKLATFWSSAPFAFGRFPNTLILV